MSFLCVFYQVLPNNWWHDSFYHVKTSQLCLPYFSFSLLVLRFSAFLFPLHERTIRTLTYGPGGQESEKSERQNYDQRQQQPHHVVTTRVTMITNITMMHGPLGAVQWFVVHATCDRCFPLGPRRPVVVGRLSACPLYLPILSVCVCLCVFALWFMCCGHRKMSIYLPVFRTDTCVSYLYDRTSTLTLRRCFRVFCSGNSGFQLERNHCWEVFFVVVVYDHNHSLLQI